MGSSTSKFQFYLRSRFDLDKVNFGIFFKPKSKAKMYDKCVEIHTATCIKCENGVHFEEDAKGNFGGATLEAVPTSMPHIKASSLPPMHKHRVYVKSKRECHISFSEDQSNRQHCPRFIKDTKHIQCRFCKNEIDRIALLEFMRLERECEVQSNYETDISKTRTAKPGLRVGEPLTHSTPLKSSPMPCRVV